MGGVPLPSIAAAEDDGHHRRRFTDGLTVNLLNPSIATFYLVIVPSFLPSASARGYFILFAAIHVLLAFSVHSLWVVAFDRVRRFFHRPAARRTLEAISGVALIGLALRVLL
jgi:threonine/homoserine/homoserine lactone efflux protein